MSLYRDFKGSKSLEEKTEHVKIYSFRSGETDYKAILTKSRANGRTNIHCLSDGTIAWEQVPFIPRLTGQVQRRGDGAGYGYGERIPLYRFSTGSQKETVLFVIRGTPNGITGLDEGIFRCAERLEPRSVHVMTYQAFQKI